MSEATPGSVETAQDIGTSERDIVRRWLLEIQLADKGEKDWRKRATEVYEKYRAKKRKPNSFNILYSNTETLRPAVYNSTPKPDVRRRYRDSDPIGKAVSQVMSRALEFTVQTYDLDCVLKSDVLDFLLTGRGLSRVRYVPSFRQVGDVGETGKEDAETELDHESQEGLTEELTWEQAVAEHVNWQDFRRGPGRTWEEIPWIAFRHRLTRDQCIEYFGERIGRAINLTLPQEDSVSKLKDEDPVKRLFETGEVWEIWNKEDKEVLFVSDGYDLLCKRDDDPLGLEGFWPIPKPLYCIEDTDTLEPVVPYDQYAEQADELNEISGRIRKIVKAIKVRGVYDSTVSEISQVMKGDDNELIAAANVSQFMERGGLEKMIWMLPIDPSVKALQVLYEQRRECIDNIYAITGISDIMRAATDPQETAKAQTIKSQWGTMRLQRMQREVARYARDLVRLLAEVIENKFQPETLAKMTEVNLPTQQQVQQQMMMAHAQWQQQAQAAQMQGQQPPPQPQMPQNVATWEAVLKVIKDKGERAYKVDIETDSTVAEQLQGDLTGLQEVLGSVSKVGEAFAPWVMQGALPVDAFKELVLTVCRRARLGNAVEDAFDKMQQPKPPPDPNQAKMAEIQANAQSDQQNMMMEAKLDTMRMEQEKQLEQFKQQMQAAQVQQQNQLEAQRAHLEAQNQAALKTLELNHDRVMQGMQSQTDLLKQMIQSRTALEVAEISAQTTLQTAQMSAAQEASSEGE